jgi:hypothetical protein
MFGKKRGAWEMETILKWVIILIVFFVILGLIMTLSKGGTSVWTAIKNIFSFGG